MQKSNKSKRIGHLDLVLAKNIIHNAFPEETNLRSLKMVQTVAQQNPNEVQLANNRLLYSIAQLSGKYNDDRHERWMYSILRHDSETNTIIWKYVHPISNEVYDDPNEADFSTLPIVS